MMWKYPSDIREHLKAVLIRNHKWSEDKTQTNFPVSLPRNGAHGNFPKLPLNWSVFMEMGL